MNYDKPLTFHYFAGLVASHQWYDHVPKELVPLDGSVTLLWSEAIMLMLGNQRYTSCLSRVFSFNVFKLIIWKMGILYGNLLYLDIKRLNIIFFDTMEQGVGC